MTALSTLIARLELTPDEELELAARTIEAFDSRGAPDYEDKIAAILEWWEHRPVTWLRRREEAAVRQQQLVELLRETDPARRHLTSVAA